MTLRLLIVAFALLSNAWAALTVKPNEIHSIAPWLLQYEGVVTLDSISDARSNTRDWLPLDNDSGQLGLISTPVWLKLNLINQSDEEKLLLAFNNRGLNRIDGWVVQGEHINSFTLGAEFKFTTGRDLALTRLNQQLTVKPNQPTTLYFRVKHTGYADLGAEIGPATQLLVRDAQLKGLELFFYGVYLTLLIYHGILYFTSRETGYLGYCTFIATSIVFFGFTEGYLWAVLQSYPKLAYTLGQGSIALMASSAALFTLQYLRMRRRDASIFIMNSIIYMGIALFMTRLFFTDFPILIIGGILTGIAFITIPIVSLRQYLLRKNPFALPYFFSWSIWSIFALTTLFTVLGVYNTDISRLWLDLKIAFAVQSLILAWSLGYRIKIINNERVSAVAQSRAKSELIARVSHEIRTPMNGIIGTSQLLEAHLEGDDAKNLNDVIYHSGISLLTIINDLLDLSRLENGKIVLEPTSFDIKQVLGHVSLTLQAQVNQKGLKFDVQFHENVPPFMRLDTGRLRQILFNLIGNAIKYTQAGHVHVRVSHDDNRLNVTVIDTGRGIPSEKLHAIFQPYEQVENNAQERRSGAGLGLHIAQSLIELMQGELHITSEVGKGTTVQFSLPAPASSPPTLDNKDLLERPHLPITILIADDNMINRKILSGLVEKLGHRCLITSDGSEAVNCYFEQYETIDMVLLDCEMPILDGYRAAAKLREIELAKHFPAKPIIAVTAHAYEGHLEKVYGAGMDGQLNKPITLQTLAQCINEFYYTRHSF